VKSIPAGSRRRLASSGMHLVSQGIGQQFGTWGIYEGEFEEGKITGYGRIIMPNQDVYVGKLVDGAYQGLGTLTLKDGTEKSGTWKSNQLVETEKGDKANYKAAVIKIPTVLRVISQEERDLIAIFAATP
jgi:hypothetical protein